MKTSSGAPLLCEKAFGKGKVLLFTSTCDRDWSDFPIRPGFLLWSRFVTEYLTQTPLSLQSAYSTGDAVRLTPPADDKGPVGPQARRNQARRLARQRRHGVFRVRRHDGARRLHGAASDQETRVGLFAVNLETYESDLTYLDEPLIDELPKDRTDRVTADLKQRLGQPPLVTYVDDASALTDALGGARRGIKLWDVLLMVVLLIGLFEPWLANQITRRFYGRSGLGPVALGAPAAPCTPESRDSRPRREEQSDDDFRDPLCCVAARRR